MHNITTSRITVPWKRRAPSTPRIPRPTLPRCCRAAAPATGHPAAGPHGALRWQRPAAAPPAAPLSARPAAFQRRGQRGSACHSAGRVAAHCPPGAGGEDDIGEVRHIYRVRLYGCMCNGQCMRPGIERCLRLPPLIVGAHGNTAAPPIAGRVKSDGVLMKVETLGTAKAALLGEIARAPWR